MAAMSAARPSFVSPRSQLAITASLVAVQVLATVLWCVTHPPGERCVTHDKVA